MQTIDDDEARLITLFRLMNSVGRNTTLISSAQLLLDELQLEFSRFDARPNMDDVPRYSDPSTFTYEALGDGLDGTGDRYETVLGTCWYDDERVQRFTYEANQAATNFGIGFRCTDDIAARYINACRWNFVQFLKEADAEREKEREARSTTESGPPGDDRRD